MISGDTLSISDFLKWHRRDGHRARLNPCQYLEFDVPLARETRKAYSTASDVFRGYPGFSIGISRDIARSPGAFSLEILNEFPEVSELVIRQVNAVSKLEVI